jgi:probable phosphoglycerate mutase
MRFPNGEALRETQLRAVGALEAICREHPKGAIAVFSHGDVLRLCVAHYLGLATDLFQRISISPASITVVQVGGGFSRLTRLNDTGPFEKAA